MSHNGSHPAPWVPGESTPGPGQKFTLSWQAQTLPQEQVYQFQGVYHQLSKLVQFSSSFSYFSVYAPSLHLGPHIFHLYG